MSPRSFRTQESLTEEKVTRAMVAAFLNQRGYRVESDHRVRHGQTVTALTPGGETVIMRVKLCWRRGSTGRAEASRAKYSGVQLMARVDGSDWVRSIERKMTQERERGSTHVLFVQRDGDVISRAARVPISSVAAIWQRQREVSEELIKAGALGRRKKNHAMNGQSPTLWLQDDSGGQAVADALWTFPDVSDLSGTADEMPATLLPEELEDVAHYSEGASRFIFVNAYERDERARRACIRHYGARCVICSFDFGAAYGEAAAGHIHVHHVRALASIGHTYTVDPVADLRPVCPNCHAVIHLGGGCRSLEEVKTMLAVAQTERSIGAQRTSGIRVQSGR